MRAGATLKEFVTRNGKRVKLRTIRWEDLDELLSMINSLVDEGADIVMSARVSREAEIDWLARALTRLEKDEVVYVVAEVEGEVVANSEISRGMSEYEKHTGNIGIAIKDGYRDLGIGTEMMNVLIEQSKTLGISVLILTAFASNERAIHVYKKVGFTVAGSIPKRFFKAGKYIDELVMTRIVR